MANNDVISRQMAIDALDVLCQEHRYRILGKRETYSQYNEAWQDALDRAEGAIFNLPSVQPDHNADVSKKVDMMHEYIYKIVKDCDGVYCYIKQGEMIRCKECKYNVSSHKCLQPDSFFLVPSDDFYCGYAKRCTDG